MENRVVFEILLAEHARRVERASEVGWQPPARRGWSARARLALLLPAWAARLTPAPRTPGATGLEGDGCACCVV